MKLTPTSDSDGGVGGDIHRGVVTAGHAATAEAAAEVLAQGGTAGDAAVAALFMSFVAEPCMSSLGGGGFATVAGAGHDGVVYDFFCQTPRRKRPTTELNFFPITVDFGSSTEDFHVGLGSIGVPGGMAGALALHADLGTMPLRELVQPACRAAREGLAVDAFQRYDFELLEPILRLSETARPIFFKGDRLALQGETIRLPMMADLFEAVAKEGGDLFYKGEIAQTIATACREGGGHLTVDDMASYEVLKLRPLRIGHHGRTILTNPLPSTGGAVIALTLHAMHAVEKAHGKHALYRAMSDLGAFTKTPANLAARLTQLVTTGQAAEIHDIGALTSPQSPQKLGGTTHFAVVDKDGCAVAITSSNGEGCGYWIPGTHVQLNNMLGEAALLPDGFHTFAAGVRLSSMMAPTVVLDAQGDVELVLGSGGAGRIPFAITQVLHYVVDRGLSLGDAVKAARLHIAHGVANIEPAFDPEELPPHPDEAVLWWDEQHMFFGGVHSIARQGGRWVAVGDARRDGVTRIVGR